MKKRWKMAKEYRTSDIKLASYLLTIGQTLIDFNYAPINQNHKHQKQRTKVLFVFELNDEINDCIIDYNARRDRVSASLLLDNFNNLKAMVANSNYLTLEEITESVEKDSKQIENGE